MSEQWKKCEGQTVDGKFLLGQFLGGTEHSAVFKTQLPDQDHSTAVIKLLFAGFPGEETRLALWKRAAHLAHPNLLAIFDCGRTSLAGSDFLYVVMEYAEENLGEILPQRALTAQEALDFLNPTLDALVYLHAKGLAQGHLKPSNLMATQDALKLASDELLPIGTQAELGRPIDIYDAPELRGGNATAKSDVWSLGVTLVEALTQQPPSVEGTHGDPVVPPSMPEALREIARQCLRFQEHQRWSVGEIAARLSPVPLAAVAAVAGAGPVATMSPLNIPVSTEPAVPLAKLTAAGEAPIRRKAAPTKTRSNSPFDYFVPAVLGAAVLVGLIFAIPKIFHSQAQPASSVVSATDQTAAVPAPPTSDSTTMKPAGDEPPAKPVQRQQAASLSPAPAILRTDAPASVRTRSADDTQGRGEVLDQVLPEAQQKALATINGTVRVVVKVRVDAAGNVTGAQLDSPGPSRYFAGLAEKAARQWQFSGSEKDGHGIPSEWLIRFEFTHSGVHAFPRQTAP